MQPYSFAAGHESKRQYFALGGAMGPAKQFSFQD
jgi:hypothetical protein